MSGTRGKRQLKTTSLSGNLNWARLSDAQLLQMRICDLPLKLDDEMIRDCLAQLYQELEAQGLQMRPEIYLGDEWFSPEGHNAIALPFYLAHERLRSLELNMMLEVEGGTRDWFMKLLRHEAGHCFDHCYGVSKQRKWKSLFGSTEQHYDPDHYRPRPYSRNFVLHLDDWYAQSHPDEDFAETFAVWLNPKSDWKRIYQGWGALKKLHYLDELAKRYGNKEPLAAQGPLPWSAQRMTTTLERYYRKRRRAHEEDFPDFWDKDLQKIFNGGAGLSKREYGAAQYLRRNRGVIINSVARWTGARKYTIHELYKNLVKRCEKTDLRLGREESETHLELSAYLGTLITTYLFTGKFKRSAK